MKKNFEKIILLVTLFIGINFSSYSQSKDTTTVNPDYKYFLMKDSVKVPFVYLKAANKAFIEVKSLRKVTGLHQAELHSKDIEISFYKYADNKCEQAYDTLTRVTLPALRKESNDNEKLYEDYKRAYKLEKSKVVGLSVGLPLSIGLGLLAGFLLFHK